MFGVIRDYELQPGTSDTIIAKIRDEFVPLVRQIKGLVSYSVALGGQNSLVTMSVFDDEAGAAESVTLAGSWVKGIAQASVIVTRQITLGEITVRHVHEAVTPGYGVMRRFSCSSESALEITRRVRAGLVPMLDATSGFATFALLVESGQDQGGASLSAFVDRETAEAANERALSWVRQNVGTLLTKPPEVLMGEIKIRIVRTPVSAN